MSAYRTAADPPSPRASKTRARRFEHRVVKVSADDTLIKALVDYESNGYELVAVTGGRVDVGSYTHNTESVFLFFKRPV